MLYMFFKVFFLVRLQISSLRYALWICRFPPNLFYFSNICVLINLFTTLWLQLGFLFLHSFLSDLLPILLLTLYKMDLIMWFFSFKTKSIGFEMFTGWSSLTYLFSVFFICFLGYWTPSIICSRYTFPHSFHHLSSSFTTALHIHPLQPTPSPLLSFRTCVQPVFICLCQGSPPVSLSFKVLLIL